MVRGEIPIESGASWISPKCVEAQRLMFLLRGSAADSRAATGATGISALATRILARNGWSDY